jgi:hypothetical protein
MSSEGALCLLAKATTFEVIALITDVEDNRVPMNIPHPAAQARP